MRKIGVHLENVVILPVDGPVKTMNVSCSEPKLALALFHEQRAGKFFHETGNDIRSAIRRIIFNDQDVKVFGQRKYLTYDRFNIFLLIIGWNYNKTI